MQVNVGKGLTAQVQIYQLMPNWDNGANWTDPTIGESLEHLVDQSPALQHIIMIGLRNILMDSHASITTDEYPDADARKAAAEAMVQKKLDALYRGEVRVQSTREGDPVRAEAMRMAQAALKAKIKAAGKAMKDFDPKDLRLAAEKLITPELLAKAKARVDEAKGADVDLSDLGL